jgi:Fe2+ or Zn2+ uptake regulation protein
MIIAKKRQGVLDTLIALRDFIWIEDLYLLLRSNGWAISSRTVLDAIKALDRIGLLLIHKDGRRTLVKLQSNRTDFSFV